LLSEKGDIETNPLLLLVARSDLNKFSNFGVLSIAYADSPVPFISNVEVELILMNYLDFYFNLISASAPTLGHYDK